MREEYRRVDDTLPQRFMTEPTPDEPMKGRGVNLEELEAILDFISRGTHLG